LAAAARSSDRGPREATGQRVVGDQTACLTPRPDGRDLSLKPLDVWTVPDPPPIMAAREFRFCIPPRAATSRALPDPLEECVWTSSSCPVSNSP
jgi:hypothetical protein